MKKNVLLGINLLISLALMGWNITSNDTLNHLYGTIAGKYAVTMNIFIHGTKVGGSMYYDKVGRYIFLRGTIDSTGKMQLVGNLNNGEKTDIFIGTYDGKNFKGNWHSPKSKHTLPFKLSRTNRHWLLLDSVDINVTDSVEVSGQWYYFRDKEHIVAPVAYPIAGVAHHIDSIVRDYVFANDLISTAIDSEVKIKCLKQYMTLIRKAIVYWKDFELHDSYDYPTGFEFYKTVSVQYIGHLFMTVGKTGYAYTGGAHGYPVEGKSIVDLYSGKRLGWDDIIKVPDTTFLNKVLIPVMRDYFKKHYNRSIENIIWDFSDLGIAEFDLQKNGIYFSVTQDKFLIDNELTPMPDFFIGFDKLKPYLTDFIKHRLQLDRP